MKNRFILALIVLGAVLWCSASVFAANPKAVPIPAEERIAPVSPVAPAEKAYCRLQNDVGTYYYIHGNLVGDGYANYFDPVLCGVPTYPFGIDTVEFVLTDYTPPTGNPPTWPLDVKVTICGPTNDTCFGPQSPICSEVFTIQQSEVGTIKRALSQTCCVNGPFYATLTLASGTDFQPNCSQNFPSQADSCRAWAYWNGVWGNWAVVARAFGAWVGYPCIRVIGQTEHPNCIPPWQNYKMHFPQLPDLIGWDVNATDPKTLADDWLCTQTGPVEDIHFWGSWKNIDGNPYTDDFYTPMPFFRLSIHRNIPASPDTPWSRPGELLWFWEGEIAGVPSEPPTLEAWYDPNTGENICNDHVPYWRYDFFFDQAVPPAAPFYQYRDSMYWLDISALYIQYPFQWGWKNSRDHFRDDAVYTDNAPVGPWSPLIEPPRCNWFDVYFDSTGYPQDMGSTNYYGWGWYRYEYWANMWFYDNPFTFERPKHIWLNFFIDPVGLVTDTSFAINWSTPEWDELGMGRPPLPGEDELLYIGRQIFPVHFGENIIEFMLPYNPEWVSIDFVANNVIINGWIYHECDSTSLDLAFVITGPECTPSIDVEKKVWDEDLQDWVDSTEVDVCNNVDFLITIVNDGTCDLTNVIAEDFMDASLEFVDASPFPDSIQPVPGGTYLEWRFPGPFLAGNSVDITVTAHVVGPACHLDSNYVFVHGSYEPDAIEVMDEDVAYVHATEEPWPDHKMHYPQLPDPNGWDIVATKGYLAHPGMVTADDFLCTESGPITDIHFWGSWLWDVQVPILGFWLSIHDNIPAPPYSRPGAELWSAYITNYEMIPEGQGLQGWYDPFTGWWEHPNHALYFRYDIDSIPEPFYQDSGTIYWLNVMADIGPPGYQEIQPEPPVWGWKTSVSPHFEDDAVWAIWTPPTYDWIPLTDPRDGITLDMAFVITSTGQPVLCGDVNNDGILNLGDVVYLISYQYKGGPPPMPTLCVGDVNNDDVVGLGDVVYLISYQYKGGLAPDPNCCNPPWK